MKIFVSLILAAAMTASPAFAQNDQHLTVRVATRDLDLSSNNGQRILKHRIKRAATELCDQLSTRIDAKVRRSQRTCRENAIIAATPAVLAHTNLAARD